MTPNEQAIFMIPRPRLARTSRDSQGVVMHHVSPLGVNYAEYIYGSGDVDLNDAVMRQWADRLIAFDHAQTAHINNGADIPPFFSAGVPDFVRLRRQMLNNGN
jgi:hypothetical protein